MPTKIEWATESWNPITGCTKVSEGCKHCYAEVMAKRLAGRAGYPKENPFTVTFHEDKLDQPYRWQKPRDIFVCSMGDLFHPAIPTERILQIYTIIKGNPHHRFLVLTKRSVRMKLIFDNPIRDDFPSNLWLGVSIENQKAADERLPDLIETACLNKFISIEPILEEVYIGPETYQGVHWIIVGDESGPNRRPAKLDWVRSIRDGCIKSNTPFFFKQWHDNAVKMPLPMCDGRRWIQRPITLISSKENSHD